MILVGSGGILGAIARYSAGVFFFRTFPSGFPLATFLVNLSGSFLMGLVWNLSPENTLWHLFVGSGFLGSFTTFSTFSYDGVQLLKNGRINMFLIYVLGSVLLGMGLASAGFWIGNAG